MPKVTWRSPCGYFVSTVCLGCTCRSWKSTCDYFCNLTCELSFVCLGWVLETACISFSQAILPSVQFSSVAPFCLTLCNPMNRSMPDLPVPSPTPGVYPDSCPLSRWCHSTISSSDIPFSSCPQSFLASGSFQMSQIFASVGQSIGVSASTSVLPVNTQNWSPLGWLDLLAVQGTLKSLLQHHSSKALILWCSAFFIVQLSHSYITDQVVWYFHLLQNFHQFLWSTQSKALA